MLDIRTLIQSVGMCGPAALRIVLNYYGLHKTEIELALLAGTSAESGTSPEGILRAAKFLGFYTFYKCNSTIDDIRKFIKKGIPVIVDWFYIDDGHYSVVAGIDKDKIILADPVCTRKRVIPLEKFERIWFDISNDNELLSKSIIVIAPEEE